jgi:hypothetical protein
MARKADTESLTDHLLPCVFTLPAELNSLVLANQRRLYPLLFECAAQSLLEFGRNRLRGDPGITAVLHTWGQKLDFHPHLHCIVAGGALSQDGKAAATAIHSLATALLLFPPHRSRYFSHALSNVRGRLRPTVE